MAHPCLIADVLGRVQAPEFQSVRFLGAPLNEPYMFFEQHQ